MNVETIMTKDVRTVGPETNLAAAAGLMWDYDCGALPVVDSAGKLVGIITDRDICIAVGTRARPAAHIAVCEAMSQTVYTCEPDDDIRVAIAMMREHRVRRVPVVRSDGAVVGIVSLNDLALRAEDRPGAAIALELASSALKAVCEHRMKAAAAK